MKKAYVCNSGQAECFLSAALAAALKFLFILHPQPSGFPKRRFSDTGSNPRLDIFIFLKIRLWKEKDCRVRSIDHNKLVEQFGTKLIDDALLERLERVTGQA
jgi:hypothetical protein